MIHPPGKRQEQAYSKKIYAYTKKIFAAPPDKTTPHAGLKMVHFLAFSRGSLEKQGEELSSRLEGTTEIGALEIS
ncbi:hypothetical protein [Pseudomonas mediterranea]|uniref:hypothetical protein n=1 Tax=Pseudomonas mediterranea TaxID=183795 RepID=UPI00128EA071|nr:hypothetical protein [Pseudomonas mediterranea]